MRCEFILSLGHLCVWPQVAQASEGEQDCGPSISLRSRIILSAAVPAVHFGSSGIRAFPPHQASAPSDAAEGLEPFFILSTFIYSIKYSNCP